MNYYLIFIILIMVIGAAGTFLLSIKIEPKFSKKTKVDIEELVNTVKKITNSSDFSKAKKKFFNLNNS